MQPQYVEGQRAVMERVISFDSRREAGRALAAAVRVDELIWGETYGWVMAPPRTSVPVAFEVAVGLDRPLDLLLTAPVEAPAIAQVGEVWSLGEDRVAARDLAQLARRARALRGDRPPPEVGGEAVLLVLDALTDAASARRMAGQLRAQGARRVALAAPVATHAALAEMRRLGLGVVYLAAVGEDGLGGVYGETAPVLHGDVRRLLERAAARRVAA